MLKSPDVTARRVAWGLTVLIAVIIGYFAFAPLPEFPGPPTSDKVQHVLAFACLCLPVALVMPRALVWLVPVALAYGGAIELIQPLVGRFRDLSDLVADIGGIALGCLLGLGLRWGNRQWRARRWGTGNRRGESK